MNLAPLPIQKFFTNNGLPADGYKLFTYASGTTTKLTTYKNSTGLSSNTNPITLDFRGECRVWIDPTLAYTFVLAPSTDSDPPANPIWTVDSITAGPASMDNAALDTGSINAVQLAYPSLSPTPTIFTRVVWKSATTNTSVVTISINGGPIKALNWQNGQGLTAGGELQTGGMYEAIYDGSGWQLQGPTLGPEQMRTPLEISQGVIPSRYTYLPNDLRRYCFGSGTSVDPFVGWSASVVALGGYFNAPAGYYNATGGTTYNRSVSIVGDGVGKTIFRFTGISGSSVPMTFGAVTLNGTPRPAHAGTVYNMGTAALTAGQTSFVFVSVTNLAIGDDICMYLGVDPNDGGQSFLRMRNIVATIVGNTVTFRTPLPEAVAIFPGVPAFGFSPTFHECVKETFGPCDVHLDQLSIEEVGTPGFDVGLYAYRCRTVDIGEISFINTTGTFSADIGESFNVLVGSITANRCADGFMGIFGVVNAAIGVLECNDLTGRGLVTEVQDRSINIDCLRLAGGVDKSATPYVFIDGQAKSANIENLYLSNKTGVSTALALVVPAASNLTVGHAWLGNAINVFPLRHVTGSVFFGGVHYKYKRTFRLSWALSKSQTLVTYNVPNGLCAYLKVGATSKTGLTRVRLKTSTTNRDLIDTGNTVDFFPAAGTYGEPTGTGADWPWTVGTDAGSYAFNADPAGHQVQWSTDATSTDAATVSMQFEMWVSADDGVYGDIEANFLQGVTTLTLNNDGGGTSNVPCAWVMSPDTGWVNLTLATAGDVEAASTGTANPTVTGVPAALRPATLTQFPPSVSVRNNTAYQGGAMGITSGGTITLFVGQGRAANSFTAAGNKGVASATQIGWSSRI